jgi:hypothetical protein
MILNVLIFEESLQYDGRVVIFTPEEGEKKFVLQLDATLEELEEKDVLSFKVMAS